MPLNYNVIVYNFFSPKQVQKGVKRFVVFILNVQTNIE